MTDDSAVRHRGDLLRRMTRTGVYLVTDDRLADDVLLERLDAALTAGADVVQFRDKHDDRETAARIGREVATRCRASGALFIVNDDAALAADLDADGLHVGQDDRPPAEIRAIVGPTRIVGLSVSALDEADAAQANPDVDYIGFGSLFPTGTKLDAEPAGPEMLAQARTRVQKPIVGIGGVTAANLGQAIAAGADAVAVISAVFSSTDPGAATRALLTAVAEARPRRAT
ncbi:MAG: thiamine phosphate synthase [Chloroflexi bacterium]|nr:thiamine phosphate synthase [Chloroflexota bacterium]